jgi:hypothetical protein
MHELTQTCQTGYMLVFGKGEGTDTPNMERGSMELVKTIKQAAAVLVAAVIIVGVVALPPVGAIPRHGSKVSAHAHYQKDQNRTLCKIVDTRGQHTKRYHFYRPGHLDDRDCKDYWNTHGPPRHVR